MHGHPLIYHGNDSIVHPRITRKGVLGEGESTHKYFKTSYNPINILVKRWVYLI